MSMGERPGWIVEQSRRVDELIDGYRAALHDTLDGLTEDEARRRLVPSKTTLLGLVKHAAFVEGVWFDQAITGRSYADIGIARTVDGSFTLRAGDTIATVQAAYRQRGNLATQPRRPRRRRRRRRAGRASGLGAAAAGAARAGPARRPRRHPSGADPRQPPGPVPAVSGSVGRGAATRSPSPGIRRL